MIEKNNKTKPQSCPACGSGYLKKTGNIPASNIFAGRELEYPLNGGGLWVCQECNLYFRWPRLSKHELDELYKKGESRAWYVNDVSRRHDWLIAAHWLGSNRVSNNRVLDIGCSTGQFLVEALDGDYEKYGIEICSAAAEVAHSRGIKIISSDIFDNRIIEDGHRECFSIVTAFDVIEHVENPLRFLELCSKLVQRGGRIIISSGNTSAISWFLSGSRYYYCVIPEHISFTNSEFYRHAASKLGLRLIRTYCFSHAQDRSKRFRELFGNALSMTIPAVFRALRRVGLGRKKIGLYPELADHPPPWMTAKDHLIVEFKRL